MTGSTLHTDDRAVSIAVTHVLAIGITTLLISTLLIGAGGVLDEQKERAAREELSTIGDRVATQITTASRLGKSADEVEFVVNQPARVSGGTYTIEFVTPGGATDPSDACDGASVPPTDTALDTNGGCLVLETTNLNVVVTVPVHIPGPEPNVEQVGSGEIEITVP